MAMVDVDGSSHLSADSQPKYVRSNNKQCIRSDRASIHVCKHSFWATVCKTVCPVLSVCLCLSVCPVCNVGILWPNGWMDQDETLHAVRPRPWLYCVRLGPSSHLPKGHSPQFSADICYGQMAGWIKMPLGTEVCLGPDYCVLDGDPAPPPQKGDRAPQFLAHVCGQSAGWIKMAFGMEVGLGPDDIVLDGDPVPPKKGAQPPLPKVSVHVCCGQTAVCITIPLGVEVGLSLVDIVLDGDPAPSPLKGHSPSIFYQCSLWPNG